MNNFLNYIFTTITVFVIILFSSQIYSQADCNNAVDIGVIGDYTHCFEPTQVDFSTDMSIAITSGTIPSCGLMGMNVDYWYQFTTTSTGEIQILMSYLVSLAPADIVIYSGTCGTLTEEFCVTGQDIEYGEVVSLSPNTSYFIQILNDVGDTPLGLMEFCIQESMCGTMSNADPANDDCGMATILDVTQPFYGSTACPYSVDIFTSLFINDPECSGFVIFEGNGWYTFTATSGSVSLDYDVSNCSATGTSAGVEVLVFDVDCSMASTTSPIYCTGSNGFQQGNAGTISLSSLTAGNNYLIMVDGVNGTNCFYSFTPVSGIGACSGSPNFIKN